MRAIATVTAFALVAVLASGDSRGEAPVVEEKADTLLKAMSEKLAVAKRIRIEAERRIDEGSIEGAVSGTIRGEIFLERPNRVAGTVKTAGSRHRFVYDGRSVTVADLEANAYAIVPAPATVDETLAMLNNDYEYEPPLADFLLSRPYESFLAEPQGEEAELKSGEYAGIEELRGVRAHHLVFSEKYIDWELWISEETSLPMRLVIIATAVEGDPRIQMDLLDLEINPPIPAETFVFVPPEGMEKIDMPKVVKE
jgi:hypothetical protein